MAEEENEGLQTDENTDQTADSQADTGTPEKKEEQAKETVDWQKRYKDLQVDHTRTRQRLSDVEAQLEKSPEEPEADGFDEGDLLDRKTVQGMIKKAVSDAIKTVRMESADSYFRRTYPDLVKHENAISGILRNPKDPDLLKGASPEERIDAAVKEFNEMTEDAKAEAKAKAEAEAKEREEQNRKASGLGGGPTPAPKSEEEGESDEDYLKNRKAHQAKKRGLS